MPSVSVVIPTYNRARYVGQAIASTLAQTRTDFEVLVVDDGSTDSTAEVVSRFTDERIRYIYQDNQSAAGARNTGIREAQADIVCFLDSDDLFLPLMLSEGLHYLDQNPDMGLIIPGRQVIDAHGLARQTLCPWEWSTNLNLHDLLLKGCPTGASAIMARRGWLEAVGGFDGSLSATEDWDLLLRLARAGCPMTWLEKVLLCYRLHDGNLIQNVTLMRDQHLTTLERAFSHDGLPQELRDTKQRIRARLLFDAALSAYNARLLDMAKADLSQAITLDPSLVSQEGAHLAGRLRSHVEYWAIADPLTFVNAVRHNLPDQARVATRALAMLALRYQAAGTSEDRKGVIHA